MTTLNKANREHLRVALVHIAMGNVPAALRGQVDGDRGYLTDALDGRLDAEGLADALAIADEYLGVSEPLAGLTAREDECEWCEGSGMIVPGQPGPDGAYAVERCDICRRFASDAEARIAFHNDDDPFHGGEDAHLEMAYEDRFEME